MRTGKWKTERREGRSLVSPFNPTASDPIAAEVPNDGLANTNVVWHGEKLLALEEAHAPFEIDPQTLDSVGPWRFDDRHVMQFDEVPLFPNVDGTPTAPAHAHLTEWIIDLADNANSVQRRTLDDTAGEFPRLDERFAGTSYRHGYYAAAANGRVDLAFNAIVRHDFATGRHSRYVLPNGDTTGEPVFVPTSRDSVEGDGYLLSVVHRGRENRSDLAFFDAENVADGPIACAELPHRVPYGFHGNWKYNDVS